MNQPSAYITDIQRFSVHDGPGIRTIVFLQGCPLSCKWCQNPESISFSPVLMMEQAKCIKCGECIPVCPQKSIYVDESSEIATDRFTCNTCGECEAVCFALARRLSSKLMTDKEVFGVVIRDETFYLNSGGGLTLSGGEPLCQIEFCESLLGMCKKAGISTAVETCGFAGWSNIERVISEIDTFLFDLKMYSSKLHEKWTGVSNELILENLKKLSGLNSNIIIRIPLIPGVNDTNEEFTLMIDFLCAFPNSYDIHILPFHHIGSSKYTQIDLRYELENINEENEERIMACKSIAESKGFKVNIGGHGFASDKKP